MKKSLVICLLAIVLICTSCAKPVPAVGEESSSNQASSSEIVSSSAPVSSEISSAASSQTSSSVLTSSEAVTSVSTSSAVSSVPPKVESKAPVPSKAPAPSKTAVSSQPPQAVESKAEGKIISETTTNFGELMDEDVVDAIIAEGIEYANSKGMTWKDNYTVEGSGYYNPAFSGAGAEIFKRDLFYHVDQLHEINITDDYYVEGNPMYYKIVKGEFEEEGYWFGYVLY